MAFIFDPSKGETPASLRKKREVAEALRANATGLASSPGEGLAMIGAALGSRIADSKANKIEAYGQQQASSALGPIMEALGGGGSSSPSPAPSAPSAPSAPASPQPAPASGGQGAGYIRQGLVQRGLPSHVADAFVANFQDESGLNPGINEARPLVPGSRGGYGLYQLTGPRRVAYENFAKQRGASLDDTDAQLDFLMMEMQGPESRAAKNILSSPDTASAAQAIVRDFLRPAPEHRERRMAKYAGLGSSSPAAQAVNAMAQGGQGMPQAAPQPTPQPMQGGGGAMDVWQGRAQQGTASDGSQLVRTPEGVQRTSGRYGYSEIIRPEGPPSERAPMPMRGQGGGIGAILSSLLGRGGQQQAPQAMPQQAAPQMQQSAPIADPAAYNEQVVRMSPDLAGGPQRMPTPQNQPPIPGIQPTAPTMADMGGRMPAPQGQPMAQGVEGLRSAMQPQQAAPQQPMPAPQAQAAPQQAQPAPQPTQAGANGISLPKLLQIAQDPWVAENKLYSGIVTTLIENQLSMNKPMNPLEKAQLEKLMLDIEQQRNPVAKPTSDMTEYDLYVEQATAAGQQPMPFLDYQQALKKSGATNVTTNVGEGDKFYENLDKKNAETFSALSETGMQGRSKLAQIDRLDSLLQTSPQGASAMLKQVAGEYGINTEGLSDIQAAQALINELVPQQRQPGSGPMSDADLALFKQSLPRLINQPEGNRMIIDTMRGITQYQIQMGEIADAVSNREMTPAEGRKAIASLGNPLAGFGKKASQLGTATRAPVNLDGYTIEEVN